jgi:hypothetical protein
VAVDRELGHIGKGRNRVFHVAVAEQKGPEVALQGLDAAVNVEGLQLVESQAQE